MNILRLASWKTPKLQRDLRSYYVKAIKFDRVTYGVVDDPVPVVDAQKIIGKPGAAGQVVLEFPQGYTAAPKEVYYWDPVLNSWRDTVPLKFLKIVVTAVNMAASPQILKISGLIKTNPQFPTRLKYVFAVGFGSNSYVAAADEMLYTNNKDNAGDYVGAVSVATMATAIYHDLKLYNSDEYADIYVLTGGRWGYKLLTAPPAPTGPTLTQVNFNENFPDQFPLFYELSEPVSGVITAEFINMTGTLTVQTIPS